jgi:hypothetical protein
VKSQLKIAAMIDLLQPVATEQSFRFPPSLSPTFSAGYQPI